MKLLHQMVFLKTAQKLKLLIGVRVPNVKSDRFSNRPDVWPKPLGCDANTADRDVMGLELAGLVVNPIAIPAAFSPRLREKATPNWHKMVKANMSGTIQEYSFARGRFTEQTDPEKKDFGLLLYIGRKLISDYDLAYVMPMNLDGSFPKDMELTPVGRDAGPKGFVTPEVEDVMFVVNGLLPYPMVQHGADFDYEKVWNLDETIILFRADGRVDMAHGSGNPKKPL